MLLSELGSKASKDEPKKTFTLNSSIKNSSIIQEIPDFGIIFTGKNNQRMSYIDFRAYCLNKGLNITNINKFVKILNDEDTANFDYVERIILTDKEILQLEENQNKKPIETKTTKKKFIIEESDIESDNSIEMNESESDDDIFYNIKTSIKSKKKLSN
jgi:hypothetical protein